MLLVTNAVTSWTAARRPEASDGKLRQSGGACREEGTFFAGRLRNTLFGVRFGNFSFSRSRHLT